MAQYEMNLRDYWLIIRRRRLWIIATTIVTMLFSLWLARQKVPHYQATATVKFEQSTNVSASWSRCCHTRAPTTSRRRPR